MTGAELKMRREAAGFSVDELAEILNPDRPRAVLVLHAEQGRLPGYHWAWRDIESALALAEAWRAEEVERAANVAQQSPPHQDLADRAPASDASGLRPEAPSVTSGREPAPPLAQEPPQAGRCLHGLDRRWCSICLGTRRIPLSSLDADQPAARGRR